MDFQQVKWQPYPEDVKEVKAGSVKFCLLRSVSEALFRLCRGTNNSTLFGVCPNFRSRTTAFIIFFSFSL